MPEVPRKTEIFNRIASKVLADLYQQFPDPIDLDPKAIGASVHADDDDYEKIFETVIKTAGNSIEYLLREGFIEQARHYPSWDRAAFRAVVLTAKGHQLLGTVPESVGGEHESFGMRLANAVEGGKWAIAGQAMRELIAMKQR